MTTAELSEPVFHAGQSVIDSTTGMPGVVLDDPTMGCKTPTGEPAYTVFLGNQELLLISHREQGETKRFVLAGVVHETPVTYPIQFALGTPVRHYKGGEYVVVDLPSTCVLEGTRQPAYGYLMQDGRKCYRAQAEFEDGRFVRMERVPDWAYAELASLYQEFCSILHTWHHPRK